VISSIQVSGAKLHVSAIIAKLLAPLRTQGYTHGICTICETGQHIMKRLFLILLGLIFLSGFSQAFA
jgi:hypothetical protein